jgi:uncharacterized membrane protein
MPTIMSPRRVLVTMVFLWCAAIVAAPMLNSLGSPLAAWGSFLYQLFSRVCHQLDERSFHIAGSKFGVCIRCTAIYFTFFLGILFAPFVTKRIGNRLSSRSLLLLSALPMAVDVVLSTAGIHESNAVTRVCSGAIFGFGLSIPLLEPLEELVQNILSRLKTISRTTYATKAR